MRPPAEFNFEADTELNLDLLSCPHPTGRVLPHTATTWQLFHVEQNCFFMTNAALRIMSPSDAHHIANPLQLWLVAGWFLLPVQTLQFPNNRTFWPQLGRANHRSRILGWGSCEGWFLKPARCLFFGSRSFCKRSGGTRGSTELSPSRWSAWQQGGHGNPNWGGKIRGSGVGWLWEASHRHPWQCWT